MSNLTYFEIAKSLNIQYEKELLEHNAHFRGNLNSCSLVSLSENTPEIGESGITKNNASKKLHNFTPERPKRLTPEKELQAMIIRRAIHNNYILPFGDSLTFITSEFAGKTSKGKKIVGDILAIDSSGKLTVIELKSIRSTKVIQQAIDFRNYILDNQDIFGELVKLITGRDWSGEVRCIAVWPKSLGHFCVENEEVDIIAYENGQFYSECSR